jgi:phenylalanyl-tRNA synthetase alpha chain
MKSLESKNIITTEIMSQNRISLTAEAKSYLKRGCSPEYEVTKNVPSVGVSQEQLEKLVCDKNVFTVGFQNAMKMKWLGVKKLANGTSIIMKNISDDQGLRDETFLLLQAVESSTAFDAIKEADLANLKRRKLANVETVKYFKISKGSAFTLEKPKNLETDLTHEALVSSSWETLEYKDYNFDAKGKSLSGGHLHPLLQVRAEFRAIFLELGFEEMQTNNFVESSFWNFDVLFQPQQHPARDSHDTFFLSEPSSTLKIPQGLLHEVQKIHEVGGYDSLGYRYEWKEEEARKNVLRTHTTAVSARYLYELAERLKKGEAFKPKRYFSIDRVFRNEAVDQTHLCEFHQVEGMVVGKDLSLGDLIGTLETFFAKIGITGLTFKPTYNPYTEPSMEIFGYHPDLKRWVEIGNSGIFRPEVLLPLGLPQDIVVLAWGLSVERPTMIKYNLTNIRDLVGHKVSIQTIKTNPICFFV